MGRNPQNKFWEIESLKFGVTEAYGMKFTKYILGNPRPQIWRY
jgi:ABC-type cobalt transport system substrate-binding protein